MNEIKTSDLYQKYQKKIFLPKQVIVGKNIIGSIADILKEIKINGNVAVICGHKTKSIVESKITPVLKNKYNYDIFICNENKKHDFEEIKLKMINKYAVILGIGGGKNIDMAKLIARDLNLDFISMPTAPSHDGIASSFASLKILNRKYSVKTNPPLAIICDISIIQKAERRFFASGFFDAYSNIIAAKDWKLAKETKNEYFGDYACDLAQVSPRLVEKNIDKILERTEEGTRTLLEALISNGIAMEIAGSSRPCSGSEHLIAHSMEINKIPFMHGECVAIGTLLCSYLYYMNWINVKKNIEKAGISLDVLSNKDLMRNIFRQAKDIGKERKRYTILERTNEKEFLDAVEKIMSKSKGAD